MSFFENPILAERQRKKAAADEALIESRKKAAADEALIESRKKAAAELGISYESYVARFIKLKGTY